MSTRLQEVGSFDCGQSGEDIESGNLTSFPFKHDEELTLPVENPINPRGSLEKLTEDIFKMKTELKELKDKNGDLYEKINNLMVLNNELTSEFQKISFQNLKILCRAEEYEVQNRRLNDIVQDLTGDKIALRSELGRLMAEAQLIRVERASQEAKDTSVLQLSIETEGAPAPLTENKGVENSLEIKLVQSSLPADEETLSLVPGKHVDCSEKGLSIYALRDILARQVFGSTAVGRENIMWVLYEADLDVKSNDEYLRVEWLPSHRFYVGALGHYYDRSVLARWICVTRGDHPEPWPVVDRCLSCLLDPADGRVADYVALEGRVVNNPVVIKQNRFTDRVEFSVGFVEETWVRMKSKHTNMKCKFAFLLYRQPEAQPD